MKILAVDDNAGFLKVLGDFLENFGHDVYLAEDGKEARELLEKKPVDLIISDVVMPSLDGIRLHSYVREFSDMQKIPFIFISAYGDEQTKAVIVEPDIDYFFSKMAPIEEIVGLIEKLGKGHQKSSDVIR